MLGCGRGQWRKCGTAAGVGMDQIVGCEGGARMVPWTSLRPWGIEAIANAEGPLDFPTCARAAAPA